MTLTIPPDQSQERLDREAAAALLLLKSGAKAAIVCQCAKATVYRRARRWAEGESERLGMRLLESQLCVNGN
jgi:hypothetical protein